MKRIAIPFLLLTAGISAQEHDAKIDSVSLFKNGLAVVRLTGEILENGRLQLSNLPDPVHGTFWIGSEKPVTARV